MAHYTETIALAALASFGLGALTVQGLHAQAKPPVYQIVENEVLDLDAFSKDFLPKIQAAVRASGGRILAAGSGQQITALDGEPPKSRWVLLQWESMEQLQAERSSAAFQEARKIGERSVKIRS